MFMSPPISSLLAAVRTKGSAQGTWCTVVIDASMHVGSDQDLWDLMRSQTPGGLAVRQSL